MCYGLLNLICKGSTRKRKKTVQIIHRSTLDTDKIIQTSFVRRSEANIVFMHHTKIET